MVWPITLIMWITLSGCQVLQFCDFINGDLFHEIPLLSFLSFFMEKKLFRISKWYVRNYHFLVFFKLLNEFYYICSCTMIITTKFYRISIPNHQCIPQTPTLLLWKTLSFSKSVSQYLLCKEVNCVLFLDSTCKW